VLYVALSPVVVRVKPVGSSNYRPLRMGAGASKEPELVFVQERGWKVGKKLGEGAFGTVMEVTRSSDLLAAACKIIELPEDEEELANIDNEFKIMKTLDHPCIVRCFDTFQSSTHMYLTLELMKGGELFDRIIQLKSFHETLAAEITYQCLTALQYMHARGICHRDLKPENVLLANDSVGPSIRVKITDFGLSHLMDGQDKHMTDVAGTLPYIAPEVIQIHEGTVASYDKQCDVWSLGVIVYIMLSGRAPFPSKDEAKLMAAIQKGKYEFKPPSVWAPVSNGAKAIIKRMLVVDPRKRASIDDLLGDDWLAPSVTLQRHGSLSDASKSANWRTVDLASMGMGAPPPPPGSHNLLAHAEYQPKEVERDYALHTKNVHIARARKKIKLVMAARRIGKVANAQRKGVGKESSTPLTPIADEGQLLCAEDAAATIAPPRPPSLLSTVLGPVVEICACRRGSW